MKIGNTAYRIELGVFSIPGTGSILVKQLFLIQGEAQIIGNVDLHPLPDRFASDSPIADDGGGMVLAPGAGKVEQTGLGTEADGEGLFFAFAPENGNRLFPGIFSEKV